MLLCWRERGEGREERGREGGGGEERAGGRGQGSEEELATDTKIYYMYIQVRKTDRTTTYILFADFHDSFGNLCQGMFGYGTNNSNISEVVHPRRRNFVQDSCSTVLHLAEITPEQHSHLTS